MKPEGKPVSIVAIVGDPIPEMEWIDPIYLRGEAGILPILKRAKVAVSLGGKNLALLLAPVPIGSFAKIRGLWVDCNEAIVYAAGNPPSTDEIRVVTREIVRAGLV